jgi:hypothetical protein
MKFVGPLILQTEQEGGGYGRFKRMVVGDYRLSLREVSKQLAAQGFLNERGKPYARSRSPA